MKVACLALNMGVEGLLLTIREFASGFRKRTLVTAKLGARVGLAMAKRQLGGAPKEDAIVDAESAKQSALELVSQLGALKGS